VASGPNSANPHATPSDRILSPGDLLVIDWGASFQGYLSDLTRTFAVGKVSAEQLKISEIVIAANLAAQSSVRPAESADEIDRAARSVIEKAGYGKYFIHRTGHGLGIEAHEEPYIRAGNPMKLEPGMTFTIEPGIYLPEEGGIRVEDNLAVTLTGSEMLSDLPREVTVVG
jgi:Xaa-Pro dipeptidase